MHKETSISSSTNEAVILDARLSREWHSRALACAVEQDYEAATALLQKAMLGLSPIPPAWFGDLGVVCEAAGRTDEALQAYAQFVARAPECARAQTALGRLLAVTGLSGQAEACFRTALTLDAADRRAAVGLAMMLSRREEYDDAVAVLKTSIAAVGSYPDAHKMLAGIYERCEEFVDALHHWQETHGLVPEDGGAIAGLIRASWGIGDLPGTLGWCALLLRMGKASEALQAFYNYTLLYSPNTSAAVIREEAVKFGERFRHVEPRRFARPSGRTGRRKLRIGYLTGEFMKGAAFFFLGPIFENHDSDRVAVFAYHTRSKFDEATEWYSRATAFRDCRHLEDEAIEGLIRRDNIDILVDLSGFFPEQRRSVFAHRAAPVQILYPNCPTTCGVPNLDYILTDRWTCPHGSEAQYAEEPVFLPSGYLAYKAPASYPQPEPPPASVNGFTTFGFFQRRAKMNPAVWDAIAAVLRACPTSRLVIQNHDGTLDDPERSLSQRTLMREFANRGIEPNRLTFIGERTQSEVMRIISAVDVALDSFPYQGQTTTCECLWLGVPVIALKGDHHVACVGSALLERAGLREFTAGTPQEYCQIAIELASAPERLPHIRELVRARFRSSPVCDGRLVTRAIEDAYRSVWQHWREGKERRE